MTTISEAVAVLAGFVLAHAAWSISDLPNGEGFVPLAVVVVKGERQLQRFVAETPDEAVAKARAALRVAASTTDAWAFAHTVETKAGGQTTPAVRVEFWSKGMATPATLTQAYHPMTRDAKFKILGDPVIELDRTPLASDALVAVLRNIRKGVASHPKVAALWDSWRGAP